MLNAQERYRDWLLHLEEDDPLRKELVAIENDENEIEERFYQNLAFGTAGIKILTSKDAKKLYTNCTAAVLRAKACVMKTASAIQENAEDIYAEAQQINEDRAAAEEVVEDTAEEVTDFREETEETTEEGSEE